MGLSMNTMLIAAAVAGLIAAPAFAAPRDTQSYTTVYSYSTVGGYGPGNINTTGANAGQTRTWVVPGGYNAVQLMMSGTLTVNNAGTWRREPRVLVTPPGGRTPFILQPFQGTTFEGSVIIPAGAFGTVLAGSGYDPAGSWSLAFFEEYEDPPVYDPTPSSPNNVLATIADSIWDSVTFTFDDAAAGAPTTFVRDFGTVTTAVSETGTAIAVNQTKWYKFTVGSDIPGAGSANRFFDIDVFGSSTTGIDTVNNDTTMALFGSNGRIVALNDDSDGAEVLSQMSFGYGIRTSATGRPYDGVHGSLPAGTYYIAVGIYPLTFADGFVAFAHNPSDTGTLNMNLNTGVGTGSPAPTTNFDFGQVFGNRTSAGNALPIDNVLWFKFITPDDASAANGKYVDIDVEGSATDFNDTVMGVFRSFGGLLASDDDDGSGFLSLLTFGATAPARSAVGTGIVRNGVDGTIEAGTYYLAVCTFNNGEDAFVAPFTVDAGGTETGTITVNISTNFASGPTRCNAADVAGLGGSIGPDGQLTADDVVVYLAAFFSNNLAVADIAVLGGAAGQDGQLTADDIVYFLSQFFAPCNP